MALATNSEVLLTEMGDGTGVLLHLGKKLYYTLNETGVRVWRLIESGGARDEGAVVTALHETFPDADAAEIDRDVRRLTRELFDEGLITAAGPGDDVADLPG